MISIVSVSYTHLGYSFGPHLHMEIRRTDTGELIDPLQFYTDKIKDTTPPRASGNPEEAGWKKLTGFQYGKINELGMRQRKSLFLYTEIESDRVNCSQNMRPL